MIARFVVTLVLAAGAVCVTGSARAQNINVSMYASDGGNLNAEDPATLVGPAGGGGETWNQFNTTSAGSLLDSTGAATGVGFTNNVGTGWAWGSPDLTMLKAGRAQFGKGNDTTHTINGLTPGALYNIWIASFSDNTTLDERSFGEWSTPNPTSTAGAQVIDSRSSGLNGDTWEYGVNYVLLENVEANGSGEIVLVGDAADPGDYGETYSARLALNGWQLQPSNQVAGPVDAGTSTVEASSATVDADGSSSTTITITLRDASGIVVSGKEVTLANTGGPQMAVIDPPGTLVSSASGTVTFTVSSGTTGAETFTATVVTDDNLVITQTAVVTFVEPSGLGDLFSVNIFSYGRGGASYWDQESWRETVRLDPTDADQSAGVVETTKWQNVGPGSPGTTTLTSTDGATATLTYTSERNASPFYWGNIRNDADSVDVGNATLLDGHRVGTEDPGDGSNVVEFAVSNIPFAAYDVIIYLGINDGQSFNGEGSIQFNGAEKDFTLFTTEPTGELVEIVDDSTPGNYLIYRGESGSSFSVAIHGDGFTHLGPAGLQIAEADKAREPLEITDVVYDKSGDQITLTWKSNPGESYGIQWSQGLTGFVPGVDPAIPANATDFRTTYGPFDNPSPGAGQLFLRIGEPDLEDPTLDRVWGNGTTVSLDFSEAMHATPGTDPSNYTLVKDGGSPVTVSAAAFHPGADKIVLTTAAALDLDADYTVTMDNLTDLAGRPLGTPTMAGFRTWDDNPDGVKVFILAGQSNMQGHGQNEMGFGGVAGAIGSLRYQVDNYEASDGPPDYGRLVDAGDNWISRADVKVWWRSSDLGAARSVKKGDLHPSFGVDSARFGPEFGFGWIVGDYYDDPVLLIKTCWGGKSLYADYRPPSAVAARGGEVGPYYFGMFDHVREVLDNLDTEFPEWDGTGYEIVGFGWHQGWNDSLNAFPAGQYEDNLVDLIGDIRAEFGKPALPVSIGNSGFGGWSAGGNLLTVIDAQLAVANPALHPEFAGTVFTAETRDFFREVSVSPADQGYHWNQNGETYFLIGDAMGQGMENLLTP